MRQLCFFIFSLSWHFVFLFFSMFLLRFSRAIVFFVPLGKLLSSSLLLHHCFLFFVLFLLFVSFFAIVVKVTIPTFFYCLQRSSLGFRCAPFALSLLSLSLLFTTTVSFVHKVDDVLNF